MSSPYVSRERLTTYGEMDWLRIWIRKIPATGTFLYAQISGWDFVDYSALFP